jgi:hypothetical protein
MRLAIASGCGNLICKNAHQFITKVSNIIPMERWQPRAIVI